MHRIPAANVRHLELSARSYGFTGSVTFDALVDGREDAVFNDFVGADLMVVDVAVARVYDGKVTESIAPTIRVSGRGMRKRLHESDFAAAQGQKVLLRRYTVEFADAAWVFWRQHHPLILLADARLGEVLRAELADGIALDQSWDRLMVERPILCIGTDALGGGASFYDALMWIVDAEGGYWRYDYPRQTYVLSAQPPKAVGTPQGLREFEAADIAVRLPTVRRSGATILNAYSESPLSQSVSFPTAQTGIRQDILLRTTIMADVVSAGVLEAKRLRAALPSLHVTFKCVPNAALYPGAAIDLDARTWSRQRVGLTDHYCVETVHVELRSLDEGFDTAIAGYTISLTAELRNAEDPRGTLPDYRPPTYPLQVEGKIRCDSGKTGDRTYQVNSDPQTSQDFLQVRVPTWNQDVLVPFCPQPSTGQSFAPLYKDQRVLLDLYFDRAEIRRCLDWCEGVRVPQETQGNQIVLGKNTSSQTALKHVYTDGKPEFSITRTLGTDVELVQFTEGSMVLQTKDSSTSLLTVEQYDLTPKVVDAQTELKMAAKGAVGEVSGSFMSSMGQLNGQLSDGVSQTSAHLDAMEAEVRGKVDAIGAAVQSALAELTQQTAALQSSVAAAKADLQAAAQF